MTVFIFVFPSQSQDTAIEQATTSSPFLTRNSALSFHVFFLFYGVSACFRATASPITFLQPSFFLAATFLSRIWRTSKGGYTLVTLPRSVTPYRGSVDGTRDRVTYQKLVTR